MDIDKKNIVIGSTLLFVFLLVLFNLEMFTGDASKMLATTKSAGQTITAAKVVPDKIKAGEYVNIQLTPGTKCVERKIQIYEEGENHATVIFYGQQYGLFGSYRFCKPTVVRYKSWGTWHGNYYALLKDITSNQYVKAPFFVE